MANTHAMHPLERDRTRRRPPLSRRPVRRWILVALVAVSFALVGGCGSSSKSSSSSSSSNASSSSAQKVHLAKTKFALHAGLAFGVFHRYIYKPFKKGEFSGGFSRHKAATAKAAVAAVFAYHEVRLALNDARSSKVLSRALAPLLALQTKFKSLAGSLKRGTVDSSTIDSANANTAQTSAAGAAAGQPVTDRQPSRF